VPSKATRVKDREKREIDAVRKSRVFEVLWKLKKKNKKKKPGSAKQGRDGIPLSLGGGKRGTQKAGCPGV